MPVIDSQPPTLSTFGSRLRYLREKKRLRQTEVAASVGMSQGNYSNRERDAYPGGTTYAPQLAAFFGCDVAWLTGHEIVTPVANREKTVQQSSTAQILRTIPLIEWNEYPNFAVTGKSDAVVPVVGNFSRQTFAVTHRGLSMAGPAAPSSPTGQYLLSTR